MCHEVALECLETNTKNALYPLSVNLPHSTANYSVIVETDNHVKRQQTLREICQNTEENG